jgi:hypothetical protein
MRTLFGFLLRVLLFAAGLVFAASLALAFVVLLALWTVRAAWARVTGRAASPFVVRFRAGQGFQRAYRRAPPVRRNIGDVTDVEPKR